MDDVKILDLATDLHDQLNRPVNADISLDFPATVQQYSQGISAAFARLCDRREAHRGGERMQFALQVGRKGIEGYDNAGIMALAPDAVQPLAMDAPKAVNMSLFICNPFRHRGLGTYALSHGVRLVDRYFGGQAWSAVRPANRASAMALTKAGFEPMFDYLHRWPDSRVQPLDIYGYGRYSRQEAI